MKNKIKEALRSPDLSEKRSALIKLISASPDKIATIDEITSTLAESPGIFQPDDGKFYAASARDMTETLIDALHSDLFGNFSIEKFQLFAEVQSVRHNEPGYFKKRTSESKETFHYPDGMLKVDEQLTDGQVTVANISEIETPQTVITDDKYEKKATMVSGIGWIIALLGVAASIVGLCIPIYFMIGVGIGVLMIGLAIVYTAISHRLIAPDSEVAQ